MTTLPIIDIAPLLGFIPSKTEPTTYKYADPKDQSDELQAAIKQVADELYSACTTVGFFYIKSNVFPHLPKLINTIHESSNTFFKQSLDIKRRIDMGVDFKGKTAWRGYFCVGDELTSGVADIKEGLYLGTELSASDERTNTVAMHGQNVFPRSGGQITDSVPSIQSGDHPALQYEQTENDLCLQNAILDYMQMVKKLGFAIIDALSLSLDLPRFYLRNVLLRRFNDTTLTNEELAMDHGADFYDPLCLYRIFNYPAIQQYQKQYDEHGFVTHGAVAPNEGQEASSTTTTEKTETKPDEPKKQVFSVGEHCDYGAVTILYQDQSGGLEVRDLKSGNFIPAPPIENTFVCNIGDIFEKITHGVFVSTPHRVVNPRQTDRISFPFFFDPAWTAPLNTIIDVSPKLKQIFEEKEKNTTVSETTTPENSNDVKVHRYNQVYKRWDGKEVGLASFQGEYSDYIVGKVSKVFPQLAKAANIHKDL